MIPTVAQVFDSARGHLGDTGTPGGGIFKDNWLIQNGHWGAAYDALYRYLDRNANKALRCTKYYNLPAYTSYVKPAGIGIDNMGKPLEIYERGVDSIFPAVIAAFNARSAGVPPSVDLTINTHGLLSNGDQVVTFGFGLEENLVSDDINGQWSITIDGTVRLLGCEATNLGSGEGASGILSTGQNAFPAVPLIQDYELQGEANSIASGQLSRWTWENGAFRFIPATAQRQIKIVFDLSGAAPLSGSVGIDDSRDALALFVAASAAASKTGPSGRAAGLWMRAIGNQTGDTTNVDGGAFLELAQLGLQAINQTQVQVPPYRQRRNGPGFAPWGGYGY